MVKARSRTRVRRRTLTQHFAGRIAGWRPTRRTLWWAIALLTPAALLATALPAGARAWQRHHLEQAAYAAPPPGMVLVPAGWAVVGTDDPDAPHDERPARRVWLPAFYMDTHEVTNADYAAFDPTHTYPPERADWPVVKVTRAQAEAYAAAQGKRLPTRAEWEKAARGPEGRSFPWGDLFEAGRANLGGGDGLQPVGSHPEGVSVYGVHDLAGNAWEWVADTYDDARELGWGQPSMNRGIIKGGAYAYSPHQGRATFNGFEHPVTTCSDLGFRCVQGAVPQTR